MGHGCSGNRYRCLRPGDCARGPKLELFLPPLHHLDRLFTFALLDRTQFDFVWFNSRAPVSGIPPVQNSQLASLPLWSCDSRPKAPSLRPEYVVLDVSCLSTAYSNVAHMHELDLFVAYHASHSNLRHQDLWRLYKHCTQAAASGIMHEAASNSNNATLVTDFVARDSRFCLNLELHKHVRTLLVSPATIGHRLRRHLALEIAACVDITVKGSSSRRIQTIIRDCSHIAERTNRLDLHSVPAILYFSVGLLLYFSQAALRSRAALHGLIGKARLIVVTDCSGSLCIGH